MAIVEKDKRPVDLVFPQRRESMSQGKCLPKPIGCGQAITAFRNETSSREYGISGLCQKCQDEVFGTDPFMQDEREST